MIVQLTHASKIYDDSYEGLSSVSLSMRHGEMAFLTGHSGAGKSTLLRLIAGVELASRGEVVVNGHNLHNVSAAELDRHRRQLGLVFQNPMLLAERTVFDNVALPLVIAEMTRREINRRVRAALDKVRLSDRETALPPMLSQGEQQRVAIARAIVNKPAIILADEPTGNLDPDLSRDIMNLLTAFNRVGVTVLIATHDIHLVEQMPHRRIILDHGRLVHDSQATEHHYEPV